ncbi:BREX system P-loop protein BrxC [Shewanella sp. BJSY2023SW005]|uniref:BREX system P-loop protein BrxC n=1 Tax=Shewanella sp. BJSY2023SW005 TaxID=3392043 RepID=UPI0039B4A477
MMQLKDLFTKQLDRPINGVVKADQLDEQIIWSELDEYVVTRELDRHLRHFFETYLPGISAPDDPSVAGKIGIWVSGYFGSGKSHFIKILSYLLGNQKAVNAGETRTAIDFFRSKITDSLLYSDIHAAVSRDTDVILFNIDSKADTEDKEDAILKVFLRVFNERLGYCADHPHIAHLERELDERGQFQAFKDKFQEVKGERWEDERDAYSFSRDEMAIAWAHATGQSETSSIQSMDNLESMFTLDIANFAKWVREYLDRSGDKRILFLVDEVGQFIGDNTQMMLKLQTITENLGTACGGRAWVIVTSQEDIDAVLGDLSAKKGQDFSKIQGRFHTRISLSSSNTSEVIQARLLEKSPVAKDELAQLYAKKGDILKNQLAFDSNTTVELNSFEDNVQFVDHYPFVPYQYLLVQKVFEAIRKVGATGKHLSRGERSLLDAFQNAARQFMQQSVGVLIPFHAFYPAIESFLDTNVKRIFEQATDKKSLEPYDVCILKTLFLIRYVDILKSTLDNLVTLSIEEIDTDKVVLKSRIEASLNRLESQLLITRNGDEYVFLTDDEKAIEQEIKHTLVESTEENRQLAKLVFDEVLGGKRQYRYPINKQDYPLSRFCNGHPLDGSLQTDLVLKVVSPLDANYDSYNEQACKAMSSEGQGCVLVRLPSDKRLWDEFDTWLKTEKFLSGIRGQRPEQEKLLAEKAMENTSRRKRLSLAFEELVRRSPCYVLGSELNIKASNVTSIVDECFAYVIENSFQKLTLLKSSGNAPLHELKAVVTADDLAQLNLGLNEQDPNAAAKKEISLFLEISDEANKPVYLKEMLDRFTARPFGWNRDEVILQLAHLVLQGKVALSTSSGDLPLKRSYDHFTSVRSHAGLRLRRVRQHSELQITKAAKLAKDIFNKPFEANEKELAKKLVEELKGWQTLLREFTTKATQSDSPGKSVLDTGSRLVAVLLEQQNNSFSLIEQLQNNNNELQDFAEDFEEVEEFYTRQFDTWQQLKRALGDQFVANRHALDQEPEAANAFNELELIANASSPYAKLRSVANHIDAIKRVNQRLIETRRYTATVTIDAVKQGCIKLLNGLPDEVCNRALHPFETLKQKVAQSHSLHEMLSLEKEADELEDDVIDIINKYSEAQKAKAAHTENATNRAQTVTEGQSTATATNGMESATNTPAQPQVKTQTPAAKPIEIVSPTELLGASHMFIETSDDIEAYLDKLRSRLNQAISAGKRVRIK